MAWRRYRGYRDYDYFEPSRPRAVQGGIKSQSKRGAFGESWWAKRWIAVLESFSLGSRLSRGRSYAHSGQVLSIAIDKGKIEAKVQGSQAHPYDITIKMKTLAAADWEKLARALSHQALFVAKLLAGEMPQEIEQAFEEAGLSLFPKKYKELETKCSCPDASNPCKHIAAVYYLLGEEFDRDPFLIFKLRGIGREELVGLLGPGTLPAGEVDEKAPARKGRRKSATLEEAGVEVEVEAEASLPSEPLVAELSGFWEGDDLPDDLLGEVRIPSMSAALPRRLGNFPFWRGEERLLAALEPVYAQASPLGLEIFLGERGIQ